MIAASSMANGSVNKLCVLVFSLLFANCTAADPLRARDLGIPFDAIPGPLNAITDVEGVTVGHETIIKDLPNNREVRTGVTAVLPRGRNSHDHPVFAGWFTLNGNGGIGSNGSGDIFIAFSTANPNAGQAARGVSVRMLANEDMDPLFLATVEATEEAIINTLVAGRDMTGDLGHSVKGIDHDELIRILREYSRYVGE